MEELKEEFLLTVKSFNRQYDRFIQQKNYIKALMIIGLEVNDNQMQRALIEYNQLKSICSKLFQACHIKRNKINL